MLLHCSYVRVQQTGDPSYSTFDDLSTFTGVKVSILACQYCRKSMIVLDLLIDEWPFVVQGREA